jgi:hypothetical protein
LFFFGSSKRQIKILLYFFQTLIVVSGPIHAVSPIIQLFSLSLANSIPLVTDTEHYLLIQLINPIMYFFLLLFTYGIMSVLRGRCFAKRADAPADLGQLSDPIGDSQPLTPAATPHKPPGRFIRMVNAWDNLFHFCQNGTLFVFEFVSVLSSI